MSRMNGKKTQNHTQAQLREILWYMPAHLDPTKGVGSFRQQDGGHGSRNPLSPIIVSQTIPLNTEHMELDYWNGIGTGIVGTIGYVVLPTEVSTDVSRDIV